MSMSATLSLAPSTAPYNAPTTAVVTISNSGGSPVNLVTLQPIINGDSVKDGAASPQQTLPTLVVPAGGSLITTFSFVPFAPQVVGPSTSPTTYQVGCNI